MSEDIDANMSYDFFPLTKSVVMLAPNLFAQLLNPPAHAHLVTARENSGDLKSPILNEIEMVVVRICVLIRRVCERRRSGLADDSMNEFVNDCSR